MTNTSIRERKAEKPFAVVTVFILSRPRHLAINDVVLRPAGQL